MTQRHIVAAVVAVLVLSAPLLFLVPRSRPVAPAPAAPAGTKALTLSQEQASAFARLAFKGIGREYPNQPGHVLNGATDVKTPRTLHPAFYGCYDWHSSVHGHWML